MMQYVIVKTQFDKHELKDTQLLTPLAGFLKCFLFILKLLLSQFREECPFQNKSKKEINSKTKHKNIKTKHNTTFNGGSLGSCIDEERCELRYVMRIAQLSESLNL